MKKILFVINTLGKAGAEVALMELLRVLAAQKEENGENAYEISLYVLTGQGEMIRKVPREVEVLNKEYDPGSVLSAEGRRHLVKTVCKSMFRHRNIIRLAPYLVSNLWQMAQNGGIKADKLLWRVLSDGGERFETEFDLAVAYLEGGSTYYVADHVNAKKKAAFVHVDYNRAGYTRKLDKNCYLKLDRIFAVSDEVKNSFLESYPECEKRACVFHNLLNKDKILEEAKAQKGFEDGFDGIRILTVGRLEKQKALEVSIKAMQILKREKKNIRWYVLGEGSERKNLTETITQCGLSGDFILCGAVENPYPYMAQADIYVHASRFEGKSIAIQEAQILGKAILVSDCSGNREQVRHMEDGIMCRLEAGEIAAGIRMLMEDEKLREKLGKAASHLYESELSEVFRLTELMEQTT